jgi:hypothetical protein
MERKKAGRVGLDEILIIAPYNAQVLLTHTSGKIKQLL